MRAGHRLELFFPLQERDAAASPAAWPVAEHTLDDWSPGLYGGFARVAAQMPRVIALREDVRVGVTPALPVGAAALGTGTLALLVTPQGDAVVCIGVDVAGDLDAVMATVRAVRDHDAGHVVVVDGSPPFVALTAAADGELQARLEACTQGGTVASMHVCLIDDAQIPLLPVTAEEDVEEGVDLAAIGRLVYYDAYRGTPIRAAQAGVTFPPLANRYGGTIAAVSPNGSVLVGHHAGLAAGMVLAHVIVLGAKQRARAVRAAAYADLERLGTLDTEIAAEADATPAEDAEDLAGQVAALAERAGRHRIDLAFGAEAYLDIEPVVPSSVIGSYHRALVEATRTTQAVGTANLLVDRLIEALGALRAVIGVTERRQDEVRNAHLTRVGGLLAAIALVLTFVFGVYGSNAGPIGKEPLVAANIGYALFLLAALALAYTIGSIYLGHWSLWRLVRIRRRRAAPPMVAEAEVVPGDTA